MARTDPTIYMRLPAELKAQLEREAFANRRSIAAEVAIRLTRSFEEDQLAEQAKPDPRKWDETAKQVSEAHGIVARLPEGESRQLAALVEAVVAAGSMQKKLEELVTQFKLQSLTPHADAKPTAPRRKTKADKTK